MEMELQAGAEGPVFAFGSSDDRLWKFACVTNGNDAAAAGAAANGRQQNRVAVRRTFRRRIDGKEVSTPR
jgi:hypothetical protein